MNNLLLQPQKEKRSLALGTLPFSCLCPKCGHRVVHRLLWHIYQRAHHGEVLHGMFSRFTVGVDLIHLPHTQTRTVSFCEQQITDEGLITICRGCHRLQSLCVSGCGNITDAILHALGQNCPRLRWIHTPKQQTLLWQAISLDFCVKHLCKAIFVFQVCFLIFIVVGWPLRSFLHFP